METNGFVTEILAHAVKCKPENIKDIKVFDNPMRNHSTYLVDFDVQTENAMCHQRAEVDIVAKCYGVTTLSKE